MSRELGFEGLVEDGGFFPRLLGRNARGRDEKPLYGPDLPVVLLTGGPGMGKQRLLELLRDRFGRKVPVAYVDCADERYAQEAERQASCRSAATEAMYGVALRMSEFEGPGGALPTPRFFAGMAAVAAGQRLRRRELEQELARYRVLLASGRAGGRGLGRFARNVLTGYLSALAGVVAPAAAPLVGAALTEFLEKLERTGAEPVRAAYGDYPGAAGSAATGLRLLAHEFQQDGEERRFAEGFLFRALREDLDAAYSGLGATLTRVGRPAVLLQHANWPVGRALLESALGDRADGHHDGTVLVASERMAEPLFLADEPRTEELARYRPDHEEPPAWRRLPARGRAGQGVLLLRMPLLTTEHIQQQLQRHTGGAPEATRRRRAQGAVLRLSRRRPRMVQRLVEAAGELPELDNDRELLDEDAVFEGEPRPVRDVLLTELVLRQLPENLPVAHTGRWLDVLTQLSVAHTGDCARALLRSPELAEIAGGLTADEVRRYLRESGWPVCEWHFIGDFGLRQLLMSRLHGPPEDGADWRRNHGLLHAHYRDRTDSPDRGFGTTAAHALHHDLVAGGPESAVRHLAATFPAGGVGAEEWCDQLLALAHAPWPGGRDERHERMAVARIEGGRLERQLDELLHAVWLCAERTRPPDIAAADRMVKLLGELAREYAGAAPVLTDRAEGWGRRARNRQPLRPCSCAADIGEGS
ncbi:hypothetical protein K378_01726 [Streptomyces sp. Amel2xB2]|uniref:hypothetical protein n=1 Tax=Streptomyces sp. Amel2xB2 TaxID=1305829 RepID=UPI000DB9C30F|nr:hypothetical protein [Streptomyces sp. Amel2xB2]RAJ68837.1 hypothetical protein K378_01726 [Streptomyces sp. Amel2xB2]